jgi:hypothetical protein
VLARSAYLLLVEQVLEIIFTLLTLKVIPPAELAPAPVAPEVLAPVVPDAPAPVEGAVLLVELVLEEGLVLEDWLVLEDGLVLEAPMPELASEPVIRTW